MPYLKGFIARHIITPTDLTKLVSIIGSKYEIENTKSIFNRFWLKFVIIAFGQLIISAIQVVVISDISWRFLSETVFVGLIVFGIIKLIIISYFENIWIFHAQYVFVVKVQNKILASISQILPNADKRLVNDYQGNFEGYFPKLLNLYILVLELLTIFVSLLISNSSIFSKALMLTFLLFIIVTMIIGGSLWLKISNLTNQILLSGKDVKGKTLFYRGMMPGISNVIGEFVVPMALVFSAIYTKNIYFVQFALLASCVSGTWVVISNLEKIVNAKSYFQQLLALLSEMQERYAINEYSFQKLCQKTTPSKALLTQSRVNKSLIFKRLIPMYYTNQKKIKPSHIYTYEFVPGMYQLNGLNGVGKTTFLESLTLPKGIKTEISSGEIAFCGKTFFDCSESLDSHREEFRYIGGDSLQNDSSKLNPILFDKYPLVQSFINKSISEANERQSEGEKGVISIASVYQDCLMGINEGLVFIDEIFSRIYGKPDYMLRQETICMLYEMLQLDDTLIIIVVDHMTDIESAKHLRLEKDGIYPIEAINLTK